MRRYTLRLASGLAAVGLFLGACAAPSSTGSGAPAAQATTAPAAQAGGPTAAPASGGATLVAKFSHVVAENTPKGKAATRFAELVKQKSNGTMEVQVFANSSLYKDAEEMDAIQKGQVEFLAPSTAKFSVNVPEWQVFDLPFIFGSREGVKRVADGPVGKDLYVRLNSAQMQGLAIWDNGFRYATNSKRQLKQPADFRGLKFRAQGKVEESIIKSLGGGAQVMAFGEVFGALQQGVVDGQLNTWSNTYTQKFHEVQKYATVNSTMEYLAYAVVASKAFWDQLTADQRKIFEDSMKEATDYEWQLAAQDNEDALAKIKATNRLEFYEWTPEETKTFREATQAVYSEYEGKVGKDLIQQVQQAGA